MNFLKQRFIFILLLNVQFFLAMESNKSCVNGSHETIEYVQLTHPVTNQEIGNTFQSKKCAHITDCSVCCDNVDRVIVTQCITCQQWWTANNQKPLELFKKQTSLEVALTRACASNNFEEVKSLLSAGVNPNTRHITSSFNFDGKTPVVYTTEPKIIDMLIAAGANPNSMPITGTTVLEKWCSEDESLSSLTIIKKLLAAGASPDLHTAGRFTPLIVSCNNKSEEIACLLLEAYANPNHQEPLNLIKDPHYRNLLKKFGALEKKSCL